MAVQIALPNRFDQYYPIQDLDVSHAIKTYPEALKEPIQKIQRFFPELLRVIRGVVGEPISIQLVVDIPTDQEEMVAISELVQRNISTKGFFPNRKGLVPIDQLFQKSICIEEGSTLSASWNFEEKTIYLNHSSYANFEECFWEDVQLEDLLFEMQNACYTHAFLDVYNAQPPLKKEEYVRRFEQIEQNSAALTNYRLESLVKQWQFPSELNFYKFTYFDNPELFYLHQQVSGHSFDIAKRYEARFGKGKKFTGTWKNSIEDKKSRKTLYDLLNAHLRIIRIGEGEENLTAKINACADENILRNFNFFQETYQLYSKASL